MGTLVNKKQVMLQFLADLSTAAEVGQAGTAIAVEGDVQRRAVRDVIVPSPQGQAVAGLDGNQLAGPVNDGLQQIGDGVKVGFILLALVHRQVFPARLRRPEGNPIGVIPAAKENCQGKTQKNQKHHTHRLRMYCNSAGKLPWG